jgi:hypothetical protein
MSFLGTDKSLRAQAFGSFAAHGVGEWAKSGTESQSRNTFSVYRIVLLTHLRDLRSLPYPNLQTI